MSVKLENALGMFAAAQISNLCQRGRLRHRGFTLVEVLVTAALLLVVIGLLMYPLMSSFAYFRSATARADAQAVARLALDSMARELAEAMYVHLDMYDNSMIAFIPALRVDPEDPNSAIVAPPRPDWSRAIRYWRALHDPTLNYSPGAHLGPGNTFYLARTVVAYPFATDDPWNRWNDTWAQEQDGAWADGTTSWSPIPRVVHTDLDWRFKPDQFGLRNATLQPGFPYLEARYRVYTGEISDAEAARLYRDSAVALTPNALEYDVSRLEFNPTVVAGEWLKPVERSEGSDYSVCRSQYPLWRLGASYTGWAALAEDPPVVFPPWARDPFLLIYRYKADTGGPELAAVGVFDPRTRTMKVVDRYTGDEIYDTGLYPYRPATAWIAFGVDWIDGSLRFDFPPLGDETSMQNSAPRVVPGSELQAATAPPSQSVYDVALMDEWKNRLGGDALESFLVPDSVRIQVDSGGVGGPDRTLTQVFCTPRENSDQFQVGLNPVSTGALSWLEPRYGWIRLPEYLSGGISPATNCTFYIDFRWRSNGVWINDDHGERPDLISAYYRTAAVLDINLTVVRAEPGAARRREALSRWLGVVTIGQSAQMTRRVKLRNLLRRIRYAEE